MLLFSGAIALVFAAALAGCTSPYGPAGPTGGFTEQRLTANTYRIAYDGNGNTPEEQVVNYWLYRAAELTVQNGYAYFNLVPEGTPQSLRQDNGVKRAAVLRPGDDGPRFVQVKGGGGGGGYVYTPGYSTTTIRTWHKKGTIVMYRSRDGATTPEQAYALHAKTVMDKLGPYVKSGGKTTPPPRKDVIDAAVHYSPEGSTASPPRSAVSPGRGTGASTGLTLDDLPPVMGTPAQ
jgi:hypothetical protein